MSPQPPVRMSARAMIRGLARLTIPQQIPRGLYDQVHAVLLRRLPDRRFMEAKILPWLDERACKDVLFVGCRAYTHHYERLLRRRGIRLWTTDIDPAAAAFGAPGHVVKNVADLVPGDFPVAFDAVVFNGVIGWGLDDEAEIARGFTALAGVAKPGAPLVLGWNSDRGADPVAARAFGAHFGVRPGPEGARRVTFDRVTHVYDFLVRRVPPRAAGPGTPRRARILVKALACLGLAGDMLAAID